MGQVLEKGKLIICHCENQSVVVVINSGYSRDNELMHLLRTLFFEANFEFHMQASHIPGVYNRLADALSRDKLSSFLPKAIAMEQGLGEKTASLSVSGTRTRSQSCVKTQLFIAHAY